MSEELQPQPLPRMPTILSDQTILQPVIWRCPNPECFEKPMDRFFDFESDQPICPKCGMGPPAVQKRALIHLLVRDPKGPIQGDMGLRYKILCNPKRRTLATVDNGEAATAMILACNCPGCLKAAGDSFLESGTSINTLLN